MDKKLQRDLYGPNVQQVGKAHSHVAKAEPAFISITLTEDVYSTLEGFKRDWRGSDVSDVKIRVEVGNGQAKEVELTLSEFLEAVGLEEADEIIKPCETCGGTGEVDTMETVYSGEPHMAPIGTGKCPDCTPEPDYEPDDQ